MFTCKYYIKDEGGKVWREYQKEAKLSENKKNQEDTSPLSSLSPLQTTNYGICQSFLK